jgi:hypothetical protein
VSSDLHDRGHTVGVSGSGRRRPDYTELAAEVDRHIAAGVPLCTALGEVAVGHRLDRGGWEAVLAARFVARWVHTTIPDTTSGDRREAFGELADILGLTGRPTQSSRTVREQTRNRQRPPAH